MLLEKEFVTTLIGSACANCSLARECELFQNSEYLPIKCLDCVQNDKDFEPEYNSIPDPDCKY